MEGHWLARMKEGTARVGRRLVMCLEVLRMLSLVGVRAVPQLEWG